MTLQKENTRITVVDALRGFALVSIMLLHNIEKFEVYGDFATLPDWVQAIDGIIWDSFFFVFGGKSYAIFALLFGLTFYIQSHNQEKLGKDFRGRFLWRMLLLLGFGIINTLFYQGEILVLYAIIGLFIIPFNRLSDKVVFGFALLFLFQPIIWTKLLLAIINADFEATQPAFIPFYMKVGEFLKGDSLLLLMKSNITNGRTASLIWFWENGRVDQTLGLFLMGFLAGRKRIFFNTPENNRFWKKILVFSFVLFFPLYFVQTHTGMFTIHENLINISATLIGLWANLALMLVIVSGFILLFYTTKFQGSMGKLSPIGKMSLTNYILQSIVGSTIYYGFGLGMYRYVGATYSLLIGIILAIAMGIFSTYWMKNHKRGICEGLWHKLTWLGTNK